MAVIYIDPTQDVTQQLDAAQDGDTVVLQPGVRINTKHVTFEVEALPPPPSPLVLVLAVNGVEKAREPVSKGDVVEVRVA